MVVIAQVLECLDGLAMMHEERRMQEHVCNFENRCLDQETAASLTLSEQMICVVVDAIIFRWGFKPVLLNQMI